MTQGSGPKAGDAKTVVLRMMMRLGTDGRFETRLTEDAPSIFFDEKVIEQMLATAATPDQRDTLKFLVDEARKKPGQWVEISTGPAARGQVMV